jgi:putative hydrolase of the HAD superfamily
MARQSPARFAMNTGSKFLLFDAYGTLVELDDFYGRLQGGFAEHGINLPLDALTRAAHREMKHYMRHSVQARDHESWLSLRRECAQILTDAVREQGYDVPLSPDAALQVLGDAIAFRTFPETIEVLERLQAQDVPMGIISNWDYRLNHIFTEMGLAQFFHFILSSSVVGREKPAPEIFRAGLEQACLNVPSLSAANCFYIGDHYDKDVIPARAAGMTPVWLVRDQRDLTSGDEHEAEDSVQRISNLRELLSLVG